MAKKFNITKSERRYLIPALLYGWDMRRYSNRWFWDGDPLMPVIVGAMAEKLISKGLLCRVDIVNSIRLTSDARNLVCRDCHQGKNYDDQGEQTTDCVACEGTGVLLAS